MQSAVTSIRRLPLAARGAVLCGLLGFVVSLTVTNTWLDSSGTPRVESYDLAQFSLGLLAIILAIDAMRAASDRRHPRTATLLTSAAALAIGAFQLWTSWDLGAPLSAI